MPSSVQEQMGYHKRQDNIIKADKMGSLQRSGSPPLYYIYLIVNYIISRQLMKNQSILYLLFCTHSYKELNSVH